MFTGSSLGAFNLSSLLKSAENAVQKIEATAQSVKNTAQQFLPPEARPASSAQPITAARASATSMIPSGIPVLPVALAGAAAIFLILKKRKK